MEPQKKADEVLECVGMEIMIDPERIRRQPDQPRHHFSKTGIQELADSIEAAGQEQSITVIPVTGDPSADFELIDGERRWLVFKNLLKRPIRAIMRSNIDRGIDQFISSTVANFCREPHTPLEIAYALGRIKKEKGYTLEQLGKLHGRTVSWAQQHLSLLKLHPSVQKLMSPDLPREQQLTFSVAILLVNLPEDDQIQMAVRVVKHKWKLKRSRLEILKRTQELEVAGNTGKSRRPSHDFRFLSRFIDRIGQDAELLLDLEAKRFDEMFANRSALDRANMLHNVEECIASLELIRTHIKNTEVKLKIV